MAATQMALPSGERKVDTSATVYGVLALSVSVAIVMGVLFGVYMVLRQGTPVWPPKGVTHQEYFDNTLAATALIGLFAGWWGLYGVRRDERRQGALGFSLALFMEGAMVNLLTYVLSQSHVSPRQDAYGVIYYALFVAVIAINIIGMGVAGVSIARILGGHVTREESQLGWAAAWYGTVATFSFAVMYALIHVVA